MDKKYAKDFTRDELVAAFISREIEDGELVSAGAGQEIVRAGILLAHLSHGPNIQFLSSMGIVNLWGEPATEVFDLVTDWRGARGAEAYMIFDQLPNHLREFSKTRVGFVGGIQIDKYGNSNLIGIGRDYKHLAFRGPGAFGTCGLGTYCKRFYIYAGSHNKKTFVENCDYVSCYGWGEGGADARTKLGLPGGGPKYCITSLCIMDFEPVSKRLRLKSIHPGVSVSQVIESTGFELIIPNEVPATETPTEKEVQILRTMANSS